MKIKTQTKIILGMIAILLAVPFAAADSYELWCLEDRESVNLGALCNPAMGTKTGPIIICMHRLNNGHICPTILNICNGLGLGCSNSTTGNTTIDTTPPVMEISSPADGAVYTSKNVLIDLSASELVDISYKKTSDPGRWTNLCSDCTAHSRERSFDEGENDITFRAIDQANNEVFYTSLFYIDSKEPRLISLEPSEGFASGTFQITFTEDNPEELIFHYGNYEIGFRNHSFNITAECIQSDGDADCTTTVNLTDYDGQQVEAYATLLDAAGNVDETAHFQLDVDNTDPRIVNFSHLVLGGKVNFILEIDEPYFSTVKYLDNSESNPKEKSLCSKLVNGVCEKEVNFNGEGSHKILIIVRDQAGNEAVRNFTFFTDSKKPKIKEILPTSGFASGLFEVIFEEENPTTVILTYGNDATDSIAAAVSLVGDCTHDNNLYYCSKTVDLSGFDDQEIEYKFKVTDLAGQTEEKEQTGLAVDSSYPAINNLDYTINGKDVFFSIEIDEQYLRDITYIDRLEPRPREKSLCNKLVNGLCEKKVSFRNDGNHEVTIKVTDLAGHVSAQNIEFFTDSKKPKINFIVPEQKFASGLFEVEFEEQNPTSLVLEYGNAGLGFLTTELSLEDDCTFSTDKYHCSTNVDLSDYEGYEIDYDFIVTDRAGQTASGGGTNLLVDTTFPEFDSLIYELLGSKKANVILQATEPNVEQITYINFDDANPREKTFCSRLSANGICEKKISINPGTNRIDFTIVDKAGNSAAQELVIEN